MKVMNGPGPFYVSDANGARRLRERHVLRLFGGYMQQVSASSSPFSALSTHPALPLAPWLVGAAALDNYPDRRIFYCRSTRLLCLRLTSVPSVLSGA